MAKHTVSEKQAQDLRIVEAYADQGPTFSRRRPRARGTAYPILKALKPHKSSTDRLIII